MARPRLGILTGISYISGLDYFRGINEKFCAAMSQGHVMVPNPDIVTVSVDCDEYVHHLTEKAFDKVAAHLVAGVDRLVAARCDLLVIASSTGHIAAPAISAAHPDLDILHIADCSARQMRLAGVSRVGLIGTQPTMEEDYLRGRLLQHGIETIVPQDASEREMLYEIICQELSFDIFKDASRDRMVESILGLQARGAQACLLGCTEIELLVKQMDVPDTPLFPSAEIHIAAAADVLLGKRSLADIAPI
jgi:aspartate racemase